MGHYWSPREELVPAAGGSGWLRSGVERCTGGPVRGGRWRPWEYTGCRGPLRVAGEVRATWFDVSVCACPMGARVVVVGVAGRGGLRWRRGTRVAVARCALLAETAV